MKPGEINDLGLGTCVICKKWKPLQSLHPKDKNKPRKERRRICSACYAQYQRETDPFFFAKKAISAHKSMAQDGNYDIRDIKELQRWQAFHCPYCQSPIHYSFTIEHIVPRVNGGKNILSNILLVCPTCNSSKQNFETAYWLTTKGYTVKPKILLKIKGAYDDHGYQLEATCKHCSGSINTAICTTNRYSPHKACIQCPSGRPG